MFLTICHQQPQRNPCTILLCLFSMMFYYLRILFLVPQSKRFNRVMSFLKCLFQKGVLRNVLHKKILKRAKFRKYILKNVLQKSARSLLISYKVSNTENDSIFWYFTVFNNRTIFKVVARLYNVLPVL